MKIFTATQLYEADKSTIVKQQISSEQLMERAAIEIFKWLHQKMQGAQVKIHIFCGIGNNGGDGLALARHLWEHGYNIDVHVVSYSDNRSDDFLINLNRLKDRKVWPNFLLEGSDFPKIDANDIIVDAIFGIGLNREPDKWVGDIMAHLNQSGAFVVSIDIPSGLYLDRALDNEKAVVHSNFVLSIQAPKLVFFLPQTGIYCEHWEVLDIGMDQEYLTEVETEYHLIGRIEVLQWYKPRKRFTHKGSYGHSMIIGGSYGKIGAVILSSKACLSTGSGLVTTFVPKCGYIPLQSAAPEIMVYTDASDEFIQQITYEIHPEVIGIGMGMGTKKETQKALESLLDTYKGSLVIDADGLNILAEKKMMLKKLPSKTILTPHPGELKRLIGSWKNDFEKLEKAKSFSKKYDCILVLKDAYTIIIYNDKGYINSTGNPGMATAGSGDVLTGMLTGLIAQGYEPLIAARMGVYLHGKAGDLAAQQFAFEALTAGSILDNISQAFLHLTVLPEPAPDKTEEKKEKDSD